MPSLEWNLQVWNRDYPWVAHGEEWTQQAEFCGVPYEAWKETLARTFLIPYLKEDSSILEIGPGHGRWSQMIPQRIPNGKLYLVDLSSSCIEYCRHRLAMHTNVEYQINNGQSLSGIPPGAIDFVFSIDTFVHIEEPEIRSYARELFRVLKPQGMGVIHHAGNPTPEQRQNGARSLAGTRLFGDIFREAGFFVIRQTSEWGNGCNLKLTGDSISIFVKP